MRPLKCFFLSMVCLLLSNACLSSKQGLSQDLHFAFNEEPTGSLFKGDNKVLSDVDIKRILAYELALNKKPRVAVLDLGKSNYWSQSLMQAEAKNKTQMLTLLKDTQGVARVASLPGLLVPSKKTVAHLREAAARFQADLLLVYETHTRTFEKNRIGSGDQVKARCTVEALILDVRTGIVPFSTTTHRTLAVTREGADLNFSETIARARAEAAGGAMTDMANQVAAFLGDL